MQLITKIINFCLTIQYNLYIFLNINSSACTTYASIMNLNFQILQLSDTCFNNNTCFKNTRTAYMMLYLLYAPLIRSTILHSAAKTILIIPIIIILHADITLPLTHVDKNFTHTNANYNTFVIMHTGISNAIARAYSYMHKKRCKLNHFPNCKTTLKRHALLVFGIMNQVYYIMTKYNDKAISSAIIIVHSCKVHIINTMQNHTFPLTTAPKRQ